MSFVALAKKDVQPVFYVFQFLRRRRGDGAKTFRVARIPKFQEEDPEWSMSGVKEREMIYEYRTRNIDVRRLRTSLIGVLRSS